MYIRFSIKSFEWERKKKKKSDIFDDSNFNSSSCPIIHSYRISPKFVKNLVLYNIHAYTIYKCYDIYMCVYYAQYAYVRMYICVYKENREMRSLSFHFNGDFRLIIILIITTTIIINIIITINVFLSSFFSFFLLYVGTY